MVDFLYFGVVAQSCVARNGFSGCLSGRECKGLGSLKTAPAFRVCWQLACETVFCGKIRVCKEKNAVRLNTLRVFLTQQAWIFTKNTAARLIADTPLGLLASRAMMQ